MHNCSERRLDWPSKGFTTAGWGIFFSSRRRHTRLQGDWSSDVCSSDLLRRRNDLVLVQPDPASAEWALQVLRERLVAVAHPLVAAFRLHRLGQLGKLRLHGLDRERGGVGKRGDLGGWRIN